METEIELTRESLRTPRAAGLAGVLFALLFGAVIVLARSSVPADPDDAGEWLTDDSRRHSVTLALNLIPFAGIAFLWFMGAVRSRIGRYEDRLFATVYLGSGLLFVAMLFVLGGVAASLIVTQAELASDAGLEQWRFGRRVTYHLMTTYAMRVAAVFTIATSTVVLRLAVLQRWIAFVGFAAGVVLLFAGPSYSWVAITFPAWVLLVSVTLLVSSFRGDTAPTST
jgi:hypothetical protein